MDAQERKDDLTEAKRHIEKAKEAFLRCGCKCLFWDANSMISDVDDEIRDADEEIGREVKAENAALTSAYFLDAIGILNRL